MMLRVNGCVNEDPGPCQGPDVHRITMNLEDFLFGEFAILFDFRFRNSEPAVDEYQYQYHSKRLQSYLAIKRMDGGKNLR